MKVIIKRWGTQSDVDKPEFQALIQQLKLANWSRTWEYPFAILNSDIRPTLKVLDAGCGSSYLLDFLIWMNCEVHGIDLLEMSKPKLNFQQADVRNLPFPSNFFDRVFCISVIEHIRDDPMNSIRELERVLKPGGLCAITTDINRNERNLFAFTMKDFNSKLGKPLGFNLDLIPKGALDSNNTEEGRRCGPSLSVIGFVLKKETNDG